MHIFVYFVHLCPKVLYATMTDIEKLYALFLQHPVVTTDSRHTPKGSMFFALKGDNFDGNRFAAKALEAGCAVAVVDDSAVAKDKRYVLVDNVLETLQQLAHYHREQMPSKMILQITGTNGKTTTKELIAAVLSQIAPVQYTQGNLNNHIGVPLTLLTLKDDGGFGIIETGANHPGEIALLSQIVDPDMGLVTNVGKAHLEGFGSFEGVKRTKAELYDYIRNNNRIGIFLNMSAEALPEMAHDLGAVRYGLTGAGGAEIWGEVMQCNPFVKMRYRQEHSPWQVVQTHLIGAYNIHNIMAAIAVGMQFGVPFPLINKALSEYVPHNNRSEFRRTLRNQLVVDAYNANPSSMMVALDNFEQMQHPRKLWILGEMRELGDDSKAEHQRIVERLASHAQDVILVGNSFRDLALPGMRCYDSVEELKPLLADVNDCLVLIKGSNGTRLFQLPEFL